MWLLLQGWLLRNVLALLGWLAAAAAVAALLTQRLIAFVVRIDRHWPGVKRRKVKERGPASSRLSATALQAPYAQERLALLFELFARRRVGRPVRDPHTG
jgi:hypothetical protein